MARLTTFLATALAAAGLACAARAEVAGERHLEATNPTAALRDAGHKATVRVTIWYPAPDSAQEVSLNIGPPDQPLFYGGESSPDAPFADTRRHPVILFSHGFGGTARMMSWFTTVLAQQGYIVIAVDHPGNNGADKMTVAGATLFWDRPGDLQAALDAVKADPVLGQHLDLRRLGIAGFSAGGFTALAAAGARVDLAHLKAFCESRPDDGVCKPQQEFPVTPEQAQAALASPELAADVAHAGDDHAIRGVGAVFLMAPAIVQAFDPASFAALNIPVSIVAGDADKVAPAPTNGGVAARAIPRAKLKALSRVGHYDFLANCSEAGHATLSVCQIAMPQGPTHFDALQAALSLFGQAFGRP